VRTGPGAKFPKIINQKATAIFGETHYITLDNSVTVKENCRSNGWSQVEVVDPNYFSASHRGWIETKALRQQQVSADGKRVFTEEDFIWDKVTRPYKDIIVKGVNKIYRENSRCSEIDPTSADMSRNRGTKENPVFFVTCGSDVTNVFNAYFSKSDVEGDKVFSAAKHIEKTKAIDGCEQYAKGNASHPSTVDFSRVLDVSVLEHPNGRTTVNSSFTAKNSFGLELKYNIRCLLDANGLIEGNIVEAR
jgi:hypothetical protein